MSADEIERRKQLHARLDKMENASGGNWEGRKNWFEQVYTTAGGDAGEIPWAELKPKTPLTDWLAANKGDGRTALDVGCGLGDNANAFHQAGWKTAAFDVAPTAIEWAQKRFPSGDIEFRCADLFNPPQDWFGKFDLVYECYTLQSIGIEMRGNLVAPLKSLVAPGGKLIILARYSESAGESSGPPWPLVDAEIAQYGSDGFEETVRKTFLQHKEDGRKIPHVWLELKRSN